MEDNCGYVDEDENILFLMSYLEKKDVLIIAKYIRNKLIGIVICNSESDTWQEAVAEWELFN